MTKQPHDLVKQQSFEMEMLTAISLFSFIVVCSGTTNKPNIVFILADDLGWDDVSFHGSKQVPTPNLDALAFDGILMANYYVQPICTPTRGALMTGRHPIHTGLQNGVIVGSQTYGLPLNETIMPEYLKKLGYRTHIIGKWHLGFFAEEYTPTRRGFESHFGYFMGKEDYWDHTESAGGTHETWGLDFRRNDEIVKTDFGKYSTELFSAEAEKIIQDHNIEEPLYLYLPFQAVHSANSWKPLEAPYKYYSKFSYIQDEGRRTFAAMVSALDDAVGNVTKSLHDRGMLNNTIIVFSTDNGGPAAGFDMNHASNAPLRGLKASLWEGGMRGDGFVWSPLLEKSGYTSHSMMQVMDWLPTLLHAAGYDMNQLPGNIDGVDHWETLSKNKDKPVRTEMLHNIEGRGNSWALRVGDMKLMQSNGVTEKWDKWYEPEGEAQQSSNLRFQEEAPADMFESPLEPILQELGRRPVRRNEPFVIKCGQRPSSASTNCHVSEKPCLFNITADPCEYNNLAGEMPEVVQELYSKMLKYKATAVPPGNKPQDPAGFPIHHGGIWVPWVKLQP